VLFSPPHPVCVCVWVGDGSPTPKKGEGGILFW
jgi:hypothetical protein